MSEVENNSCMESDNGKCLFRHRIYRYGVLITSYTISSLSYFLTTIVISSATLKHFLPLFYSAKTLFLSVPIIYHCQSTLVLVCHLTVSFKINMTSDTNMWDKKNKG